MLHQVRKRFKAEGRLLQPGEIVETSSWKNERLLLMHGFIGEPSVPQGDSHKIREGDRVQTEALPSDVDSRKASTKAEEVESSGANSEPEPPKAVPTTPVTKPAVLKRAIPVVGKVPVAKAAKQVK